MKRFSQSSEIIRILYGNRGVRCCAAGGNEHIFVLVNALYTGTHLVSVTNLMKFCLVVWHCTIIVYDKSKGSSSRMESLGRRPKEAFAPGTHDVGFIIQAVLQVSIISMLLRFGPSPFQQALSSSFSR